MSQAWLFVVPAFAKNPEALYEILQALQNFLQALQKNPEALQISALPLREICLCFLRVAEKCVILRHSEH